MEKIVAQLTETDNKYIQAIDKTDAYSNGNVMFLQQGVYMGPASYIATAYVANFIYGDRFSFDVDSLLQDYIESYHGDLTWTDYDTLEYFDLADLNQYLASH